MLNPETPLTNIGDAMHTLDDELNQRTGTPHWSMILDELQCRLDGTTGDDHDIPIELIMDSLKSNMIAFEKAVVEINALNGLIDKIEGDE